MLNLLKLKIYKLSVFQGSRDEDSGNADLAGENLQTNLIIRITRHEESYG
jgi:hypothetical protein